MPFDAAGHLDAARRRVVALERGGRPTRAVVVERRLEGPIGELWEAVTSPERLRSWFVPVTGDLRLGGRYQLEGNASGVVTACEPPSHFALTWEFGGDVSWVELRLSDDGAGGTRLVLTHTAHLSDHWEKYGPSAVGIAWEMSLAFLALHVVPSAGAAPSEEELVASPEGRAFVEGSGEGWARAAVAAGTDPDKAHATARRTAAFYTGQPEPAG